MDLHQTVTLKGLAPESTLWDAFLATATNGDAELEAYLRRAVGYTLQGTVTERAFFFVYGPPGGTKSTFLETISAMFGEYAIGADPETWLLQSHVGGNRGDLVRLMGARMVVSAELRKGARFDEALLKRAAGGDPVTAAAKYESEVTFAPNFALWLAANDPPAIRDDDAGMWVRTRRIPFAHVIPPEQQDRTMKERLRAPEVLSAVLAWAVRGCLEWQSQGLGTCAAVAESTEAYRGEMDRAAGFFEEECVFAAKVRIPTSALRKAYESWADENDTKALSRNDFSKRLEARGCTAEKSHGVRYWVGVRLLDDFERGTRGSWGTRATETFPMSSSREGFRGNDDPHDPHDPRGDGGEKLS